MRYSFIETHRALWPLPVMCRVLEVSKSGYFVWRDGRDSPRRSGDRALTVRIQAIHQQSRKTYGSPRIHAELKDLGIPLGRKRVERLMKYAGIAVLPHRRFVTTTDSDHDQPIAPNLLEQDFTAAAPNQRWVTDITYIPTDEGWLFVAAIVDLYSRRVVGWAMQPTMHRSLVLKALEMAVAARQPSPGLIHHSDRRHAVCQ